MAEEHRERANSPRVLLVDDEPIIRDAIVSFLPARGGHVIAASSAVTALNILSLRAAIDVLVSDIQMPTRDGFWLIREVRSKPLFRSLPAIAFTPSEGNTVSAFSRRFSEHVVKGDVHGLWLMIQALRRRAAG